MDHAYHTELLAVRRRVYASIPDGLKAMASIDKRQAASVRFKPRPDPSHPHVGHSPAQAVLKAYADARDPANQKRGTPGMAKAIMLEQLARGAR